MTPVHDKASIQSMDYKGHFYQAYRSTQQPDESPAYFSEFIASRSLEYRHRIKPFLPPDPQAVILDVGCGAGTLVGWLRAHSYQRSFGVDISEEELRYGRAIGFDGLVLADMAGFLDSVRTTFDMIVLRDVLEHVPKAQALDTLRRCWTVLRPGGSVYVQVPNGESPMFGRTLYGDVTHEEAYTTRSLTQLLGVAGYLDVQTRAARPIAAGPLSLARLSMWFAYEVFFRLAIFAETGRSDSIVTENLIAVARKSAD